MAGITPKQGKGTFQWNTGAWFGGQVGSTCWLFILGIITLTKNTNYGLLILLCFLLPNLLGTAIWRRRDRIAPYPAIQLLMLLIGGFALLAFMLLDVSGLIPVLDPTYTDSPRKLYWFLLIFPALMALFFVIERGNKKDDQ